MELYIIASGDVGTGFVLTGPYTAEEICKFHAEPIFGPGLSMRTIHELKDVPGRDTTGKLVLVKGALSGGFQFFGPFPNLVELSCWHRDLQFDWHVARIRGKNFEIVGKLDD